MNSDPIEDSPPKRVKMSAGPASNWDDGFGENAFDDSTVQLIDSIAKLSSQSQHRPQSTHSSQLSSSSPLPPAPPHVTQPTQTMSHLQRQKHQTQPTQPWATPQKPSSQILVPATSPPSSAARTIAQVFPSANPVHGIAPPGTSFRPPTVISRTISTYAPQTQNTQTSDPPIALDSDSDDELAQSADIPTTTFARSTQDSLRRFRETTEQYSYSVPQKRPADSMMSGYDNASRPAKPVSRQTGPSRAVPRDVPLDINALSWQDREKIQQIKNLMPQCQAREIYAALQQKRGNADDAINQLMESQSTAIDLTASDDEKSTGVAKVKPEERVLKRATKRNPVTKTMTQKYSNFHALPTARDSLPSPATESPPPRKWKRLTKKRRSPSLPPVSSPPEETITIDSDSEAQIDDQDVETNGGILDRVLNALNTCTEKELKDLVGCTSDDASLVFSKRPFKNLDAVRKVSQAQPVTGKKRGGIKTTIGERIVSKAVETEEGLEAVDRVVKQCDVYARDLRNDMKDWGIDFSKANEDGVNITSLADSERSDSGTGTPTSSEKQFKVRSANFLKQPAIMSDDIKMKDYQIVGLNWLNLLWSKRRAWSRNSHDPEIGCILADDMGLGKTCQVIALLSHLLEIGVNGPHLIVVPASTIENWLRELQKFSPELQTEPYHGLQAERRERQHVINDNIKNIHVIVTTYDTATKDDDNKFLRKLGLKTCIFDEGHALKNSASNRYRALRKIKTSFRLLLTGTPLQNNLQELMSVLAFIMPDLFSACQEDFELIFSHRAKTSDKDHGALLSARRIARAKSMLTPFILRRTKAQVMKDLPKKTKRVEYCDMLPRQQEFYSEYANMHDAALAARKAGETTEGWQHLVYRRQAAIHPLLLPRTLYTDAIIDKMWPKIPRDKGKFKKYVSDEGMRDHLNWKSDFQLHLLCQELPQLRKFALKNDEWMESGKVGIAVKLIQQFTAEGGRTLLFSHFTSVLDILEAVFDTVGISRRRIDGGTPVNDRQFLIDEFYDDESIQVFMLSTRSGGAGINLACANKVIIFDSGFNPQDDIQAENRAHRIGQTRDVEVVTLITKNTIEEQIYALGESKRLLDDRVTGGDADADGDKADKRGMEDLERLLVEKTLKSDGDETKTKLDQDAPVADLKDAFLSDLKARGVDVAKT